MKIINLVGAALLANAAVAVSAQATVSATLRPVATAVPSRYVAASVSSVSVELAAVEPSKDAANSVTSAASQRMPRPLTAPRKTPTVPLLKRAKPVAAPAKASKPSRVLAPAISAQTVDSYVALSRSGSASRDASRVASTRSPVSDLPTGSFRNVAVSNAVSSNMAVAATATPASAASSTRTTEVNATSAASDAPQTSFVSGGNAPKIVASAQKSAPQKAVTKTTVVKTTTVKTTRVAMLPPRAAQAVAAPQIVTALPKTSVTQVVTTTTIKSPVKIARRTPTILRSRSKDRLLLAQMESDLRRAQGRLNNANATLSRGQNQLMKVSSTLQQAMLEAGSDAKGLHPFVRVAQRYAGTPYVWGGESRKGFDCSGFIIVVMRDLGYRALPHSAAEQFNYGTPIAKPLIKPGDIVFFKNTYKRGVSHVGIAIGRNRFIHAAGTGTGTIVSSLSEPKWVEKYAGARRLVRN